MPITINRAGAQAGIAGTYWAPSGILQSAAPRLVILASAEPTPRPVTNSGAPESALPFLKRGMAVVEVAQFSSGHTPDPFKDFYTTYNRTELQNRVADLLTVCSAARSIEARKPVSFRVILAGKGHAGLWALLAAPGADAVIADCDSLDVSDETALLAPDLFCPGILAMGGFEGAAMLATPHPLILHNTGSKFHAEALLSAYLASGTLAKVRSEIGTLPDAEIARYAAQF